MEMDNQPQRRASDLTVSAEAKFGSLSDAEKLLLQKAPGGDFAICGPNKNDTDPNNDPKDADNWEPKRQIRGELLGWLCMDREARKRVHWRGVQVYGADITGPLDLSFVSIPFPLALQHCRLTKGINLMRSEVSQLDLQGSLVHGISADGVIVKNEVFLRNHFAAVGWVRLVKAQIGGDLDCDGGTFTNPDDAPGSGTVLFADRIDVKGSVFFRGSVADGQVHLLNANIGGDLDCRSGTFTKPLQKDVFGSGKAFSADRVTVRGSVFFNGSFAANGEVRLLGAQIGGNLSCEGGNFTNPPQEDVFGTGKAFSADRVNVKGSVHLNDSFAATGEVRLVHAQIGGDFNCERGNFQAATLNLNDASAGAIYDPGVEWPAKGKLFLDGFVYGGISSPGRIDVTNRLDWLGLQPTTPFRPRPYLQLAKVFRESGDSDGALRVLEKMEELRRSDEEHGPIAHLESLVLRGSIGYGYYPARAIWEIVGLSALGWIIYRRSYLAGTMVPTDKDAYMKFQGEGQAPPHYPNFSPLVYSVENSLPLVKLGQADKWQPDPEVSASQNRPVPKPGHQDARRWARLTTMWDRMPTWLRDAGTWTSAKTTSPKFVLWFLWIQILLGWLLATLFVAGVSGIVHKE
jgi:hypothetical protein